MLVNVAGKHPGADAVGNHVGGHELRGQNREEAHAEITQSEVDDQFAMCVPVFGDFGKGMVRMTPILVIGNSTRNVNIDLDRTPKKVELNSLKDILKR